MRYLNLGCGSHWNSEWTNINFTSTSDEVIAYDLSKGIRFSDNTADVIYHSHLLEHFSKENGEFFLLECYRVLKRQGIIRVVIPDLERLLENYFIYMKEALEGNRASAFKYRWTLIELFDQMVREKPGGDMRTFLETANSEEMEFIRSRLGKEAEIFLKVSNQTVFERFRSKSLGEIGHFIKREFGRILMRLLAGKEASKIYYSGLFRRSGEVHYWMYDRYSLTELLSKVGFYEINVCSAFESKIPNFANWELDVVQGTIRKPDSLFMEAIKP